MLVMFLILITLSSTMQCALKVQLEAHVTRISASRIRSNRVCQLSSKELHIVESDQAKAFAAVLALNLCIQGEQKGSQKSIVSLFAV